MKNFVKVLATVLATCVAACALAACDDGTTAGGSATGSTDLYISDPLFDFIKEENYDPETYVFNSNKKWNELDVDSDYYLFLNFDVSARRDNDGQSVLNVNITFDALNVLDATVQEANTGAMVDMQFIDASTGTKGRTITLSFKVPPQSAKSRNIEMTIKLKPAAAGESHVKIGYQYDADDEYKILGSDGYTKNLQIKTVQIAQPQLELTALNALTWKHVKNADYYQVFTTGNTDDPITDFFGEPIVIEAKDAVVGGTMVYNIAEYLTGYHSLVIKAFSNNKNIVSSPASEPVENIW